MNGGPATRLPRSTGLATTILELPELPEGSTFASAVIDASHLGVDQDLALQRTRTKLTHELGREPDLVALLDREQVEWLLSETQPGMGPGTRMMIAVNFPKGDRMPTHKRFVVRVADHEAADPSWRVRHAAETIGIVYAYFTSDASSTPIRSQDGTFEVHAPSRSTLDTLRQMLVDHEGLTIISEDEVPGNGIIIERTE